MKALIINCTLKPSPKFSNTGALIDKAVKQLEEQGAKTEVIRLVDHNVKPGNSSDEGKGDDWPKLRRKLMAAQIFILGAPIWLGQPSSIAKRVMERMDAFLGEIGKDGRYPTFGKVAIAAVVGNEDGAHHVTAEFYQALTDVGFTVPGGSSAYWVGEAMHKTDYKDLPLGSEKTDTATATAAANAAHLAGILQAQPYPAP